jgi:hypothetical protein
MNENNEGLLSKSGRRKAAITAKTERKFYRSKAKPYIVYLHLVAIPHKFYFMTADRAMSFKASNLGRLLMLRNQELYTHLKWLDDNRYIEGLKIKDGYVRLRLPRPANYKMFYTGETVSKAVDTGMTIASLYEDQ